MDNQTFECSRCKAKTNEKDNYCKNCGILFSNNLKCHKHPETEAEGACVICSKTFCNSCGSDVDDLFLCYDHENFEIIQEMARVFGSSDIVQIEFAKDCLEKENLHPFIFSKKASPMHLGGADYSLFQPAGAPPGNPVNEIKLMVPTEEVLKAYKLLTDLEIIVD